MNQPTRRDFVKTMALGTAGLTLLSASSYARILGANERIRIGIIGCGRMARGHLKSLLEMENAQVIALCDVYQPNLDWSAGKVEDAALFKDYRELLDRKDVDAVLVGTPDHWHALPTVHACQAGKDVYVEKPTAVRIAEGRKMVETAREHDRIVQVGTQQRSGEHFNYAAALVRAGKIGKVSTVRTWNYGNDYPQGIGSPEDGTPPEGLDWDLWLGPAPWRPFNENRFGVFLDEEGNYERWASFRWFWDYAGGMMTDWGVHLLDIVQWAMDVDYPESVAAMGGKFHLQDNRETPDTIQATFKYPTFICTYENRVCNERALDGYGYGISFHGTEGTLYLDRSGFEIVPEPETRVLASKAESVGGHHRKHVENFLECVRTRQQPICDIEIGHRSSSTAILGNIAYRLGRTLHWDGEAEKVKDDDEANAMLDLNYREPWTLD